jgi:hypothetical protein
MELDGGSRVEQSSLWWVPSSTTWGHGEVQPGSWLQWQGSVLMPTREHGDVPGRGSRWGTRGCPEAVQNWPRPSVDAALWRAAPISHRRQHLGEQALYCVLPRQHSGVDSGGRGVV